VLNGSKTFITNGPYADTIVFICKLDEGNPPEERKVLSFVLDRGMPGLVQSKPIRKMGMHSSPTGELFLDDVRVGRDRLIGETEDLPAGGREGAKATFQQERSGVAAMALGIIEECLELSVQYARDRVQFGRPIGEFQLIQEKLARMEVARMNVQNLVFRTLEMSAAGRTMTLAEASAMKLYSARAATEVALEAVQLFGGNGYMAEFRVEQLARDAKVLQIYAGTDEIQITSTSQRELCAGPRPAGFAGGSSVHRRCPPGRELFVAKPRRRRGPRLRPGGPHAGGPPPGEVGGRGQPRRRPRPGGRSHLQPRVGRVAAVPRLPASG
jgi:acyl-CoA dehydrogenase